MEISSTLLLKGEKMFANPKDTLERLKGFDDHCFTAWEMDFIERIETKLESDLELTEKEQEKLSEIDRGLRGI
jgi:hypothetical protein